MVEVLEKGKADAVLAASIFHFGMHTVAEAKEHFAKHGVPVRPSFSNVAADFIRHGQNIT